MGRFLKGFIFFATDDEDASGTVVDDDVADDVVYTCLSSFGDE